MPHVDRLALAVQSGALALPAARRRPRAARRPLAVPRPDSRATGSAASRASGRSTTRSPRPATPSPPRAEGPAAMVVVNLTRSRAENLGNVARGLDAAAARRARWSSTGAKSDGVDSLARQVGAGVAARGRLRQGARPGVLARPPGAAPRRRRRLGARRRRPARNADGFLTAPGMFSPERADPGSRRLAAALAGRLSRPRGRPRRRLGLARAGRAGARARPSPSSTSTRPSSWRSTPRAPTSPTRARASTGPTSTGLGAGRRRPTTR